VAPAATTVAMVVLALRMLASLAQARVVARRAVVVHRTVWRMAHCTKPSDIHQYISARGSRATHGDPDGTGRLERGGTPTG